MNVGEKETQWVVYDPVRKFAGIEREGRISLGEDAFGDEIEVRRRLSFIRICTVGEWHLKVFSALNSASVRTAKEMGEKVGSGETVVNRWAESNPALAALFGVRNVKGKNLFPASFPEILIKEDAGKDTVLRAVIGEMLVRKGALSAFDIHKRIGCNKADIVSALNRMERRKFVSFDGTKYYPTTLLMGEIGV